MGKNLDKFRAGEYKASLFLAITLRLALGKPDLSDDQWADWQRLAGTLKGDPEELAAAMQWAVNDTSFWAEVCTDMPVFVRNLEKILPRYRGAARKARLLSQAQTTNFSEKCRALQAEFPHMLREKIEVEATKKRVGIKAFAFKKKCPICKGRDYIPSKDRPTKGVMILCPNCQAFKSSIWDGVMRQIHEELYG